MFIRIVAIAAIWACTAIAWGILGTTIFARTYSSDNVLRGKVGSTWGRPQVQKPAAAYYTIQSTADETTVTNGVSRTQTKIVTSQFDLPLDASRIDTRIDLDHRRKGLLWYSTYGVAFRGDYTFRIPGGEPRAVTFKLPYPAEKAVYDGLVLELDGKPLDVRSGSDHAAATAQVAPGKPVTLRARYRSQGMDSWRYSFGDNVAGVKNFELAMHTNFRNIDFPEDSLSPTDKRQTNGGWHLGWRYASLISGVQIAMAMPQKLQPGELAGHISYFAPVSLFFFFFLMWTITTMRGIELHPMNYFFLAAAFFAFHLLLAYLVDHISIHAAFAICSAVSVFLVVSYLRLVVGPLFAMREAAAVQFVYLVLFSYAFFFKGYTGLAITIGAIMTLFVVMQMTARIRWSERFAAAPAR